MTEVEQKAEALEILRATWVREVELATPLGVGDVAQAHRDFERWMAPFTKPRGNGLVMFLTERGLDEVACRISAARTSLRQAESRAFLELGLDWEGCMETAEGVQGDWAIGRLAVDDLIVHVDAVEDWHRVERFVAEWQAEVWMAWRLGAEVEPGARVMEYTSWLMPNVTWAGDSPVLACCGVLRVWDLATASRVRWREVIVQKLRARAPLD